VGGLSLGLEGHSARLIRGIHGVSLRDLRMVTTLILVVP
jgi:hypothetical protein